MNRSFYRSGGALLLFIGLKLAECYVRVRVFTKQVFACLIFKIGLGQRHAGAC